MIYKGSRWLAGLAVGTLLLSGCGAPNQEQSAAPSSSPAQVSESPSMPSESASPSMDPNETMELRVTRMLLDPTGAKTDEEVLQSMSNLGVTGAIDGDHVILNMTAAQQQEALDGFQSAFDRGVDQVVSEDNGVSAVEISEDHSQVTLKVDKAVYTDWNNPTVTGMYIGLGLYQELSGTAGDSVDVTVNFVDEATGETLHTGSLREWIASQQG